MTLVTGANGFVGSHLVSALLAEGSRVRCLVRRTSDLRWIRGLPVEFASGELSDRASLLRAVRGVNRIFHLAGVTRANSRESYFRANARGTENLLSAVSEAAPGIAKFVYISSLAAAGPSRTGAPVREDMEPEPVSWYGMSKLEAEKNCLSYSDRLPVSILRPPPVYGPRDTDFLIYFKLIARRINPALGWGSRYASLVYVDDLIQACLAAGGHPDSRGRIFFVVSDECVSYSDLASAIAHAMGKRAFTLRVPFAALTVAAACQEMVSRWTRKPSLLSLQKVKELRERSWVCSGERIRTMLGCRPRFSSLAGIPGTVAWYRREDWI
ncbi:NAD-dependent epimerase/dehydratase family protein [bacterium]|nr:NAD-dependent epimerase/dehydratase family protein [bacterium]